MEIKYVETVSNLKELYNCSAMTWEGLREQDWEKALEMCSRSGKDGTVYITEGKVMNALCHLKDDDAYPDTVHIVSIKDFEGIAIMYGARWMDDIIDNNAGRAHYKPFKK